MPAVQQTTYGLTPMQMHLVSMLNFNRSEQAEQRLKVALEKFYLSEFNQMKSAMRQEGTLTEDIITAGAHQHFRTPY